MTVYVRLPNGNLVTRKEHDAMLEQEKEQAAVEVQPVQVAPAKQAAAVPNIVSKPVVLETKDDNKV